MEKEHHTAQHRYQYPIVTEIKRNGNLIMERNVQRLQSNPDVVLRLHGMPLESLQSVRENLGELATRVAHDMSVLDEAIAPLLPVETPPAVS